MTASNTTTHVGGLSLEIRDIFKVEQICNVNVGLSFAKGAAECRLEAKESAQDAHDVMLFLYLKSPIVCVEYCQFAITIRVGNTVFYSNDLQRISACSMAFKLNSKQKLKPFTLNDLNRVINHVRRQSSKKTIIFFDIVLTITCDPLSPLQLLLCDIAAPDLTDFTFIVDDEYFPAHKCIIAARSPVLATMLSNKYYSETQQSLMGINDCTKSTFMLFLQFMYGANVPYISLEATVELLQIAEKYQTTGLKKICEKMLMNKLTEADPVHNIYQFANQYNCSKELIEKVYSLVHKKYFTGVTLPEKLSENPNEVQRLVEKMEQFNDTLNQVNAILSTSVTNSN